MLFKQSFNSLIASFAFIAVTTSFNVIEAKEVNPVEVVGVESVKATIYKNKGCSCCDKWATHLDDNQFETTIKESPNLMALKSQLGVPAKMSSCHTAVIQTNDKSSQEKYIFEGHVPAKFIPQFLENPPEGTLGLAVPAMPVGSPGMEYQDKFMPYKVFLLHKDGQISVYHNVDTIEGQF